MKSSDMVICLGYVRNVDAKCFRKNSSHSSLPSILVKSRAFPVNLDCDSSFGLTTIVTTFDDEMWH
jgi:hypothetical protein